MGKKPTYEELEKRVAELENTIERNSLHDQLSLIKERNYYQDELDTLQNYLFNIINSMPSILIVVDKKLVISQWNLQAELETGVMETDAKGCRIEKVFPRISNYMKLIEDSILHNRIKTRLRQNYYTGTETRFEDIIIYPLITKREEGLVIRMDDITDQVRLEEMMIQSEKMLSIGGLAAGMAHEINNPLAGMMQNAQVVHNRLANEIPANKNAAEEVGTSMQEIRAYAEKRQIYEKLNLINETGSRAAEIIRNMLGFARKSDVVFKPHHLSAMLRRTVALAKSDYNLKKEYDFKQIDIVEEFDNELDPVLCDKNKIQQVLFNLLKNGAEAMFSDRKDPFTPQFIFRLYREDKMACIEIENNGPPINAEELKRLFEPFFTTKPVGKGTGLGLSLSYFIIVNDHKGEMTVESSPEDNTKFIIRLPY